MSEPFPLIRWKVNSAIEIFGNLPSGERLWVRDCKKVLDALDAITTENAAIKAAIEELDRTLQQQVGPDGFIDLYVMLPGAWHKLLGFARGVDAGVKS